MHSGELLGNRFTIVVRNITGSDRDVERALSRLRTDGFVNYFGMQRFGSGAVPSVAAGKFFFFIHPCIHIDRAEPSHAQLLAVFLYLTAKLKF